MLNMYTVLIPEINYLSMSMSKQTEDAPKQLKREYIWVFFGKFRVVSVCFGLLRNNSVCFGCFDIGSKHRNKPKFSVFGFTKQTETNAKQILFRFVSVRTENYFCLFRGHPRLNANPFSTSCTLIFETKDILFMKNVRCHDFSKYKLNFKRGDLLWNWGFER